MDELTVAERIDHYTHKYHMTTAELARRLGISERALRTYKKEPERMRWGLVKKMSKLFNCPVEHLMEGR